MIAVAKLINLENEDIENFLKEAKPLEHRTEKFFTWAGLEFINDSKATNVDSANVAINTYKNAILICGGYDKKVDLKPLAQEIKSNIKEVYLIGVIAEQIKDLLLKLNFAEEKIHMTKNIKDTLLDIKKRFTKEDKEVILLSPATSSFDQFKSFEHRGQVFKELVLEIFGG